MKTCNNTLQLVSFLQADKLDELGFDYPTRERYDYPDEGMHITESATPRNHNDRFCWVNKKKNGCSAPTVALALKWMRDVKHIPCGVYPRSFWNNVLNIADLEPDEYHGCGKVLSKVIDIVRDTHEAAESALLDELLELIANVHDNPERLKK